MRGSIMIRIMALMVCLQVANAEDALVQGGKSPTGKYEVRLYRDRSEISGDDDGYSYEVFDVLKEKVLKRFRAGGTFADYNGALVTSKVMWAPSGHFFWLTDHGGRHDMDLYLYKVAKSDVIALTVPDYLHRALSLVGADRIFRASVVEPIRWDGDTLVSSYYFDAEKDSTISGPYTTQFTLSMPKAGKMDVELTGMDQPVSNPND